MNSLKLNFQEGDLPSLHPHDLIIHLRGISIAKCLFECLTRIDSQGKAQLAGAESVDVSPDRLRYIFKLRDNKWSDGTPVTAHQYEKAWKEAVSPTSNCSRADLLFIIKNAEQAKKGEVSLDTVGVKAIDARTLEVELAYPTPFFLELIAQPICAPLLNVKKKEPNEFNGPFVVDSWKHEDNLRLKQNPHYWNNKKISLQQIDVYMVQDTMAAFAMYENKQIDWIGLPLTPISAEIVNHLEKTKQLKSHQVDRSFWMFLNTQHPPLSSLSIRQALSLAVDREAITKHIFVGCHPLKKPLPETLLTPTTPSSLEKNLVAAQQAFEKGLQELGLTRETFPPLEITYSQQAGRKQLAEYLQQVWSETFNIKVKAVAQEWNVLRKNLEKGLFQVCGCFEAPRYKDPVEVLDRFASLCPSNFSQWVNEEFNEKVKMAKYETNQEKRTKILLEAERILSQQAPVIPLFSDQFMFAYHLNLQGYIFDSTGACDFSHVAASRR